VQIIKSYNTLKKVTLFDGTEIFNDGRNKMWIPEYGTEVACAPYGNHFIFEVPERIKGVSHLCSCGAPAVIVGAKAYAHLSSMKNAMMVCQVHTQTNKHADGSA
jgi:hypothetical protein